MRQHQYRDLIVRAVGEADHKLLDKIIAQLRDADRAKEILRAKGYGDTGITTSAAASLVPAVHPNRRVPCELP